jgi:hypothetical protein
LQCLVDAGQAAYFDLRYKGVMMHVLVKIDVSCLRKFPGLFD